ncbi:MAG: GTP-binding protein, partial [Desulfobacterales bacterium]
MSEKVEHIRNIALIGHGGAGKTSLAEAMLYDAGVIKRLGSVDEGNSAMDFEPEELKRRSSISSGFHQISWKNHTISLIDTPGDQNFFSDTKSCMQAADGVVVVVDAVDGIKVQTEQAWEFAKEFDLPCVIFINRMDRERADFNRTFEDAKVSFDPKPIILQVPMGSEAEFKGVVDLIRNQAYGYGTDGKAKKEEIPADLQDLVETEREALIENIAEADDALVEKYLEGEELSQEELNAALRNGTLSHTFVPVICGSATKNIGIDLLMDFIVTSMPSPADRGPIKGIDPDSGNEIERAPEETAPFSAFVVKTLADPYAGRLTIFRVVSGKLGGDGTFYNPNKDSKERFTQLLSITGKEQKAVTAAGPGAIAAVAKLKETATGDTLCDSSDKIQYACAEPQLSLISFAMTAKSKGDEDKVFISLTKLLEEDPSLKLERVAETK